MSRKCQQETSARLTADYHLAFRVDAVNLENRLCDVETNRRDRLHVWLLRIRSPHRQPLPRHLRAGGGAVHSINSGRHQDVIASFELRWWHLGLDTIVTSEWGHAPRSLIVIAASRGGGRWQCEKKSSHSKAPSAPPPTRLLQSPAGTLSRRGRRARRRSPAGQPGR